MPSDPPSSEFDVETAVTQQPSAEPGRTEFAAQLHEGWTVGGGINGGLLLSVIGRAMRETVPTKPDAFALSAYYLSAGTPGPATVRTRILRDGGSTATVSAELSQEPGTRVTALGTMGSLADLPETETRTAIDPPDLPPREECVPTSMAPEEFRKVAPLMDRFQMLFDPRCIGWAVGEPSGRGMFQAWFRLIDDREPDPLSLLLAVDALPPVTMDLGRTGWAPTLELTAYLRAVPAPGWLRLRHETRVIAGGMFEEDCVVFDSEDTLVAQSRQLARFPR